MVYKVHNEVTKGEKKLFQLGQMYNNKVYIVHKIYVFYKYEKKYVSSQIYCLRGLRKMYFL